MRGFVALILIALSVRLASADEISKMALVSIDVGTEITAPVDAVWSALTQAALVRQWYPPWSAVAAESADLTAVGRTAHFTDEYGNQGRSVVLFVAPREELRVAHVPHDGSYLCQTTILLHQTGRRTTVRLREQYSDQLDAPVDRGTAVMTRDALVEALESLKKLVE